jgi:hypothetical protein
MLECYKEKCLEFGLPIEEHGINVYHKLDKTIEWIANQEKSDLYELSLTMAGMMIPLEKANNLATLAELPEGFYDDIVDTVPMYESKLFLDIYRVNIINELIEDNDNVVTLKWKLRRLEKYYKLGIDEYKKQYKI